MAPSSEKADGVAARRTQPPFVLDHRLTTLCESASTLGLRGDQQPAELKRRSLSKWDRRPSKVNRPSKHSRRLLEPPVASQRHLCEHAFVTSQGSLHGQFARACERGNYLVALGLARQLAPLSLGDALSLLVLIAKHEPHRFDAAAVRWHGRLALEGRGIDLRSSTLAAAALCALSGPASDQAERVLRSLV